MSTVVNWNSSGSRTLRVPTQSKWGEVARGLRFVFAGYLILFVLAAPGALLWSASQGAVPLLGERLAGQEEYEVIGLLMGPAGAVLGCGLILLGQWLCLVYAPQEENAKELVFVCLLAAVVAIPLAVAAPFLGSAWDSRILDRFLDALHQREVPPIGSVLQATALALVFLCLMTFSQFTRIVAVRFENRFSARAAEFFFLYLWLLLGGAVGAALALRRLLPPATLVVSLGAVCAVAAVWQTFLIAGALRSVRQALRSGGPAQRRDCPQPKRYSGLHRIFIVRAE
jgi:hypothetical protein